MIKDSLNKKTLGNIVLVTGIAVSAANLTSVAYDASKNIGGDGIKPANSITARALGINTGYDCQLNMYHSHANPCDYDPFGDYTPQAWCCDDHLLVLDSTDSYVKHNLTLAKTNIKPRQPLSLKEKVATRMSRGIESLFGFALIGLGLYSRKDLLERLK